MGLSLRACLFKTDLNEGGSKGGSNYREREKINKNNYIEELVVPRGGIEPPTRGFSIRCSTN